MLHVRFCLASESDSKIAIFSSQDLGRSASPTSSSIKLRKMSQISNVMSQRKASKTSMAPRSRAPPSDNTAERPFTVYGSRKVVEEKTVTWSDDDSSSGSEYSDDDVYVIGKGSGLKPIEGQPGMYYKVIPNTFLFSDSY